jgi:hypothetical protein
MWLKLLYFMRINKHTGYLIRMIVKVIFGMRSFLIVLFITIIAFGDAFVSLRIPTGHTQEIEYAEGYIIWRLFRFIRSCFLTF